MCAARAFIAASILAGATTQAFAADSTVEFKNPFKENIGIWAWCYQHKSWANDRKMLNVPRETTRSLTLHPGKYRFLVRNKSQTDIELGDYDVGHSVKFELYVLCAAEEEYVCPKCGQKHRRVVNKERYRLVEVK